MVGMTGHSRQSSGRSRVLGVSVTVAGVALASRESGTGDAVTVPEGEGTRVNIPVTVGASVRIKVGTVEVAVGTLVGATVAGAVQAESNITTEAQRHREKII